MQLATPMECAGLRAGDDAASSAVLARLPGRFTVVKRCGLRLDVSTGDRRVGYGELCELRLSRLCVAVQATSTAG